MKKEIRDVDKERGILQVTIADERFYVRPGKSTLTGLPEYEYVPSVTYITSKYPKSTEFYKWLASKGWDEAEAIKHAAGDKGSKVHYAIGDLLDGKEIRITTTDTEGTKILNPSTGKEEEITIEEYECLMAFQEWYLKTKPETIARELVVWNDEYGYAGTIDYLCKIGGVPFLIDFKTSQRV